MKIRDKTARKVQENEIINRFLKVRSIFPFQGYMDNKVSQYIAVIQRVISNYSPESGSKILSIGSGPCDLEAILSNIGYNVTAIDDLNDLWHLLGNNKERIKNFARKSNVNLIVQSAESIKQRENYFDVVLLIDIIEHLHKSPRELLNYSISTLKPGGLLIVETPNSVSLVKRLSVLFGKGSQINSNFFYWNCGDYRSHVKEYTQSELKQILSYHNLIEIKSKLINCQIDRVETHNLLEKIVVKIYQLPTMLFPTFKDTILISGIKNENWSPTPASITKFKTYYPQLEKYNLDNESDDAFINKMINYNS